MTGAAAVQAETRETVRRHPAIALGSARVAAKTFYRRTGETLCSFLIRIEDLDEEVRVYSTLWLSKEAKGEWSARIHVELPISIAVEGGTLAEKRERRYAIRRTKLEEIRTAFRDFGIGFREVPNGDVFDLHVGRGKTREAAIENAMEAGIVASIAGTGSTPEAWVQSTRESIERQAEERRRRDAQQQRWDRERDVQHKTADLHQQIATEALRLEEEGLLADSNVLAGLRQLVLDLKSVS